MDNLKLSVPSSQYGYYTTVPHSALCIHQVLRMAKNPLHLLYYLYCCRIVTARQVPRKLKAKPLEQKSIPICLLGGLILSPISVFFSFYIDFNLAGTLLLLLFPDDNRVKLLFRQQKRKRDEGAISSKEEASGRPWKRKSYNKQNNGKPSARVGNSDRSALQKRQWSNPRSSDARDFKRDHSVEKKHSNGRRVMKNNNNREGNPRKPVAVGSKFPRHKKVGRK